MSIYFIVGEDESLCKIGFTAGSTESRLRALQTGSPVKLRVVTDLPGTLERERQLHQQFRESREHGEWFRMTPELESLIFSRTFPAQALKSVALNGRTGYRWPGMERYLGSILSGGPLLPSDGNATT